MSINSNTVSPNQLEQSSMDDQVGLPPGNLRRFWLVPVLLLGSVYGANALAACSSLTPTSGQTVTCDTSPPAPSPNGVIAPTGNNNITVNVLSASGIATTASGSQGNGVSLHNNSAVNNKGSVSASGERTRAVRFGGDNNSLQNDGTLLTTGNFAIPASFIGSDNTLTNSGVISASGPTSQAIGFGLFSGGTNSIVNTGTITSSDSVAISTGGGTEVILNSGLISGGNGLAIELKGGNDQMTLFAPNSSVVGDIDGGSGMDTFGLGGSSGAGILDVSTVLNFEVFQKSGAASWTLTGNGAGQAWTVDNGPLLVNGTVGNVTVNSGGLLGGIGSVGTTTVAGTLAPGNSIGTLTVNGNLTFQPGARYQVELDESGASDRTVVNGAVTLGGAGLDLIEHQGAYQRVTTYEIISNDGADPVIGVFGPIIENLLFLDPTVNTAGGDGNDVVLTLTRNDLPFCGVGGSGNDAAVCKALDIAAAQGLLPTIESHLLSHISEAGARNSYGSLSGASHASFSSAMFEAHRLFALTVNQRTVEQRLWEKQPAYAAAGGSAGESADSGAWLRGIGLVTGKIDDDSNAPGLSYQIGGVATGYDMNVADVATVGLAAGYTYTSAEFDRFNNTSNVNSYQAGAYGMGSAGPVNLYGMLGYAYQDVNTTRNIQVGNQFRRTANANYGGNLLSTYAEASMPLVPVKSVVIEPLVSVFYVHRWREDFTETGAGEANLVVNSEAEDSLRTLVGARASMLIETDIGTVIPQIRARWEHEYLDTGAQVNSTFAGAPGIASINVQGVKVARDSALIGTGISLFQDMGLALQLDYDLRINADQVENLLSAGLSYAF